MIKNTISYVIRRKIMCNIWRHTRYKEDIRSEIITYFTWADNSFPTTFDQYIINEIYEKES